MMRANLAHWTAISNGRNEFNSGKSYGLDSMAVWKPTNLTDSGI